MYYGYPELAQDLGLNKREYFLRLCALHNGVEVALERVKSKKKITQFFEDFYLARHKTFVKFVFQLLDERLQEAEKDNLSYVEKREMVRKYGRYIGEDLQLVALYEAAYGVGNPNKLAILLGKEMKKRLTDDIPPRLGFIHGPSDN